MRRLALLTLLLVSAAPVRAQLPAPNAAGVSAGHMHMMVRDPAAHKKIWVDVLGAQVVKSGTLELLKLPGIFLVLGKAEPAEGSEGSTLDHFAFRVKDLPAIGAKLKAAGIPLTRDDAVEIVAIFPDKVKVEFYAAPTLSVPAGALSRALLRGRSGRAPGLVRETLRRGDAHADECERRRRARDVFSFRKTWRRRRPRRRAGHSITSVSR